jgi:hypothetical protein
MGRSTHHPLSGEAAGQAALSAPSGMAKRDRRDGVIKEGEFEEADKGEYRAPTWRQMLRVRSQTPGHTPPRLFGKCAGETSSSLPRSKHTNTQRFTLVQAARGDLP